MKFDVVKLGNNSYRVRVRYYEWGIKLFSKYIRPFEDTMLIDKPYVPVNPHFYQIKRIFLSKKQKKIQTLMKEIDDIFGSIDFQVPAPSTKKLFANGDEQTEKTDFENNFSDSKEQCTKLYDKLIDKDGYRYKDILSKFEDWDVVGGLKMKMVCLFILYIVSMFYFNYLFL